LQAEIHQLEQRLGAWQKQDAACRAIAEVPGIGKLTATALVATMGDARTFKSGREFAAFLGLVPRQSGKGGKVRLGAMSKRGDPYLRTLLIRAICALSHQGANAVAESDSGPPAHQRCSGGCCKQDGANGMGDPLHTVRLTDETT
jgi:transposase